MEAADMTDAADASDQPPGVAPGAADSQTLALGPRGTVADPADVDDRADESPAAVVMVPQAASQSGYAASESPVSPRASAKYPQNWRQRKARYIPTDEPADSPGAG
jgi:hypothetical protein